MSNPSTITPTGDMTIFEVADLKGRIQTALKTGSPVTLDLHQVGTVDASVLQLFIAASLADNLELVQIPDRAAEHLARLGWVSPKGHKAA